MSNKIDTLYEKVVKEEWKPLTPKASKFSYAWYDLQDLLRSEGKRKELQELERLYKQMEKILLQLSKESISAVDTLCEKVVKERALDSQYLQQALKRETDKDLKQLGEYLDQYFPDGNVSLNEIEKLVHGRGYSFKPFNSPKKVMQKVEEVWEDLQ